MHHELFFDHIFEAAAIAVCGYIAHSVNRLNTKVAIYVEKLTDIAEAVKDHEDRIRDVEVTTRRLN